MENGGDIANEICYTYDAAGNQTSVTDVNGNTYRYEYDLRDREVAAVAPDGGKTRVVYDKNSNIISRYMPLQKENGWKYNYDSSNRMTEVITPEGKLLNRFTYEADGQLAGTMDETGGGIRLTYDLAGRRIHALTMGGSSQSYRYDAMGNILRAEDGEGHAVLYGYDLNGNMVSRIDQLGARESFGYDRENRLVSMTDRNGTRTHITYNMYHSITGRRAVTADQSSTVTDMKILVERIMCIYKHIQYSYVSTISKIFLQKLNRNILAPPYALRYTECKAYFLLFLRISNSIYFRNSCF